MTLLKSGITARNLIKTIVHCVCVYVNSCLTIRYLTDQNGSLPRLYRLRGEQYLFFSLALPDFCITGRGKVTADEKFGAGVFKMYRKTQEGPCQAPRYVLHYLVLLTS